MRNWWESKQAAWGESLVLAALAGIGAYLKPLIGIPVLVVVLVIGIWLIRRAYKKGNIKDNSNVEYVDKMIINSKTPEVLQITATLQKISDYQDDILSKLLAKNVKQRKLADIQTKLQTQLNINPQDNIFVGNAVKIELIKKQMKKLGLYTKNFEEKHVQFMVEAAWVLDKFDVGMPQYFDEDGYIQLKTLLNDQTKNISGEESKESILIYEDLALGLNSVIAYYHYFPKKQRIIIAGNMYKSIKQMRYERDQMLKTYLQQISKQIEGELYGRKSKL